MSSKTKTTAMKDEATSALVPKLRFPEFRGAEGWKQTPLGDCLDYQQPTPYLVADTKYSPAFKTPVLTAGKTFILGHTDEQHGIFSEGLPVVIFDDFTTATQFVDFPFKAKSSAMKILQAKNGADIKFMYETLQTLSYEVGAHERHWISNFAPMLVPVPKPAEQQKIAECLSSVDELMAAQARKVDALKTHKKGLMQQLFPREGDDCMDAGGRATQDAKAGTQPRLRFPEFQNAGEWEVRTIGEMFSLINGCAFKPEDWKPTGTPIIRIQNLNDPSAEFNYSQEPVPERNRVESGDLLFAWSGTLGSSFGARIWNGPSGVLNQHIFKVLMDEQQITLQFALLVLTRVEEEIARRTHGFKASFVHVKKSDLVQVEMLLPSLPEQQRIATCLSSLDALITLEAQKLEALKTHKKGLMQQLFPSPEAAQAR